MWSVPQVLTFFPPYLFAPLFTVLCYSSRYFSTAANDPVISHIHRKQLTSALKNKVDSMHLAQHMHQPSS